MAEGVAEGVAEGAPPEVLGVTVATLRRSRRCATVEFRAVYLSPQLRRRQLARTLTLTCTVTPWPSPEPLALIVTLALAPTRRQLARAMVHFAMREAREQCLRHRCAHCQRPLWAAAQLDAMQARGAEGRRGDEMGRRGQERAREGGEGKRARERKGPHTDTHTRAHVHAERHRHRHTHTRITCASCTCACDRYYYRTLGAFRRGWCCRTACRPPRASGRESASSSAPRSIRRRPRWQCSAQ